MLSKINDEYREIPTTLIDDYIIENNSKLTVDDRLLRQLEKQSGENLNNKHGIIKNNIMERNKQR
jgi:hypothetical protein